MYKMHIVLAMVVLYLGLVHSWDLVATHGNILEFYTNEAKTHNLSLPANHDVRVLAYDEVHNMLLCIDKQPNNDTICGFYIFTKVYSCFSERNGKNIHGLSFDPVTELVFFSDTNERSINWISLKPESNYYVNLLIKIDSGIPTDIAVDSCRGYVYWISTNLMIPRIERVRFDGSGREIVMNLKSSFTNTYYKLEPHSLIIDQGIQKMYWMEPRNSSMYEINYANLNGDDKKRVFFSTVNFINYKFINPSSNTMAVSKTNLYRAGWYSDHNMDIAILGKTKWIEAKYLNMHTKNEIFSIVAKYPIKLGIQDKENCEALTCLEQKSSVESYCVHGVKVFGRCLCKCAPGYIGKRCDVSVCDNYCIQGSCSINIEGLPECRCNSGYSGERCEINTCCDYCQNNGVCVLNEEDAPFCECVAGYQGSRCEVSHNTDGLFCVHGEKVIGQSLCKCAPGYIGERCDVSVCDNYCLQGYCSVNNEGLPQCRCNLGYSGERCEHSDGLFCVHGKKVLGQSFCKCAPGYIGERCDVSVCDNYCLQGFCSVSDEGFPKCRCYSGYSGERCGNSDGLFCVHGEKVIGQSLCKCAPGYIGERCDVSVCDNYCLQGSCSINNEGLPECRCLSGYIGERCEKLDDLVCVHGEKVIGQGLCKCAPGYSGERCDVSVCDNYCLQGDCSISDEGLPKCRCNSGYIGERCEKLDDLVCVHGEKVIGQSLCKCTPGYIGERCDVSVCDNYCLQGNCSISDEGLPKCRCNSGYIGERCEKLDDLVCVHGEKVIGQSLCKCAPGYSGERCDVSVCDNYCLQGDCSISDEGLPKCRCNSGFIGEKCEKADNLVCVYGVKVIEESRSFCKCHLGYFGEQCSISRCQNYCLTGTCTIDSQGFPNCSGVFA